MQTSVREIEKWRNKGSAAKLLELQKFLYIDVNDDGADPWTMEMRGPVEIKIEKAMRWLEVEAKKRGLVLTIEHRCLPLSPAIACPSGKHINQADYSAGPGNATWMNIVASGLTSYGQLSECWERLFQLAGLPLTEAEGSAILFCVRRYVPSVAFPYSDPEHSEFKCERGIIYDNGGWEGQTHLSSLIIHELLHLYGAVDLAPGKSHQSLTEYSAKNLADIMHTPTQRPLEQYKIGDLTGYLIGWSDARPDYLVRA